MDLSSGDYYRRLRVSRTASRRDIKLAFRRLARQYHPDLHPNQPGAAANFLAIKEAYEVLIDRVQRQHYDEQIARADYGSDSFIGSGEAYRRSRQPKTSVEFYLRGVRSAIAGRYAAAIKDYSEAIALDADFAEAYLRRAEVRYLMGQDSDALTDCQRAIALNPAEARSYYYQGLARYRLGYVQSAIAAFSNAIDCDGEDARYYSWRGTAHQDLHEIESAAKDYRCAAQLYRAQGDVASYQKIQQSLKQLGTAGQSGLQKLISQSFRYTLKPLLWPLLRPFRKKHRKERSPLPDHASMPHAQSPSRRLFQSKTYWAPGVSSRPSLDAPSHSSSRTGLSNLLRLLSNPAGEMVPFYHHLPVGKRAIVGYGLAVLANLCFVLGATQYLVSSTWQLASVLWVSGGLTFVAMVFALSVVRLCLRVRGAWAADIFILGTTLIPLGLLAVVGAVIPLGTQFLIAPWDRMLWLGGMLIAVLWMLSHASIALHSGLCHIHTFSKETAAWLTPVLLGIGATTGVLTWVFI